ncbi:MAG: methyltransferase [Ferruginibacter sp.]
MFRFKQFSIQQDQCAMKVCTDACLFGAWVAAWASGEEKKINRILDIGTGTGLLSLMLAQKINAVIDTVEINRNAALQAKENIAATEWKEQIRVFETAVQDFSPAQKYNLIISNPPFFKNDLHSPAEDKNTAKHSSSLSFNELFEAIRNHISENGFAAILLPYHRKDEATVIAAKYGLHLLKEFSVKQGIHHNHFRTMLLFGDQPGILQLGEITIRGENSDYTESFKDLLKDYYLYL